MKRFIYVAGALALTAIACKTSKKAETTPVATFVAPKPIEAKVPVTEVPLYQASRTRVNDIINTKLEVSFDYARQYLYGKATLTVKPYFYPSFYLELDAKGMDLKEVSLLEDNKRTPLKYTYDKKVITITLDKVYRNNQEYKIFIDYVAKPNDVKQEGSAAITEAKGLYFINPLGKDKTKPIQVWTQGETESNSCWFPTIDSPNEKMTQEIAMTVDTAYVTLSNGLLLSSKNNGNGTRTDYWKQSLPASTYLTMMAVGKFSIIKSKWRKLDVNYYVEPAYEKYAKSIFGNTPEMMEFFSNKLGVDYPWEKFSQIVVREYVSGAMENTSAVVHGEFLQRNDRELLDNNNEEVISHELFHHWFGDLVTAESWSNLPLNESFATYGEYLWNEHKYGQDEADCGGQKDLEVYLQQAKIKNADLIRFDYKDKEDMFDGISYHKGGRVIHMLRKYVGDEAFFKSLNLYLTSNKFKNAEIHNLRLAFEEVTGEDLNWFFNQWFLNHGHPELVVNYSYNDTTKKETISVEQVQDLDKNPLYKLPVDIALYAKGRLEKHRVIITKVKEDFTFDMPYKPDLVNFDSDKMLLCTKVENKTPDEYAFQYNNAPLYLDRMEAIQNLATNQDSGATTIKTLLDGLEDNFWNIRLYSVQNIGKALESSGRVVRQKLMTLAKNDDKSAVRAAALRALAKNFEGNDLVALYKEKINDPSYMVMGAALEAYGKKQPKEAMAMAKYMEADQTAGVIKALSELYFANGTEDQNNYLLSSLSKIKGAEQYLYLQSYSKYFVKLSDTAIVTSLKPIEEIARNASAWYVRLSAAQILMDVQKKFEDEEKAVQDKMNTVIKEGKSAADITAAGQEVVNATKKKENIVAIVNSIKENERDPNLVKIYRASKDK